MEFDRYSCGLAKGEPSDRLGIPVESEKRTVTGIGLPVNIIALLRLAAPGVALKVPSATTPLA